MRAKGPSPSFPVCLPLHAPPLMRTGAAPAVTYDKEFIAVRHESDLLTPLFHAPLVSLSVRELGYVGAFVMCAMLSFSGAAPGWLAAAGLALAAAAFFRWRGELPEAYLYYAALAALAAAGPRPGRRGGSGKGKKGRRAGRRGRRRGVAAALLGRPEGGSGSAVVGPGVEYVPPAAAPAPGLGGVAAAAAGPTPERVELGAAGAPVDLTLDVGAAHGHAAVTVCVDGAELVRDAANGEGEVTVTMIPAARRAQVFRAGLGRLRDRLAGGRVRRPRRGPPGGGAGRSCSGPRRRRQRRRGGDGG